jgi:hypothetical protein
MCFDTAFKDIWKGSATSVTRASLRESRSIIARRVGSANAANTASRRAVREAASFRASSLITAIRRPQSWRSARSVLDSKIFNAKVDYLSSPLYSTVRLSKFNDVGELDAK